MVGKIILYPSTTSKIYKAEWKKGTERSRYIFALQPLSLLAAMNTNHLFLSLERGL
jgi:hypothetical protein